ncbi:hypothetical protein GCM10009827_085580 [Dactylosporangium maewongense]|uniref:Integral membrane protein n=1 Tax=Dactylosporangium maewongense TaxID=634393 RepID=A0ABN2C4A2_9ACTN
MVTGAQPILRRLTAQGQALFEPVYDAVRLRRYDRLWLGPAVAVLVTTLAIAARTRPGHPVISRYAVTHPGDPLPAVLLRLPLSLFAPAALLPFWFAVMQVLLVFSLTQAVLGTVRAVLVAVAGHSAATLSAALWIAARPPVGLGMQDAHLADAGPSAAVVAVLAYAAVRLRIGWLAAVLPAYHATEVVVVGGLPSREHLVATLTGVLLALVPDRRFAGILAAAGDPPGPSGARPPPRRRRWR